MNRAKEARLREEFDKLRKLESRSKFIKVATPDLMQGYPPEKYIITYTCMGIARIDDRGNPVKTEHHQVEMLLPFEFPNREPNLRWLTPIWHPNIEHEEPNHVCTNNIQSWFKTKSLDFLVIEMGEMVQYKRYHARWEAPYPIDRDVATWVMNFAEPQGIVGPNLPFDKRPLLRKMASFYPMPDAVGKASSTGYKATRSHDIARGSGGLPGKSTTPLVKLGKPGPDSGSTRVVLGKAKGPDQS
jgi:ubiquitin-protein ligase